MSTIIRVRNGTPAGNASLCETCRYAHIQRDFSDSEEQVRCSYHDAPLVVQFSVRDCTHYANKLMKTIWEMEKAATILEFKTIAQRSSAGFGLPQTAPSKDEHD